MQLASSPATAYVGGPLPNQDVDGSPIVCRCLRVSAATIEEAIVTSNATTVREVGRCTGAGHGCTVCHRVLRQMIADCNR